MSDTPKLQEAADGGCPPATCSRLSDLLPPTEIVEAAERVKVWMEVNGYQNWQLAGICDRRIAYQRDQMESALMLAARWGISSDGYSAEVSSRIRCWIIGGMKGEAPKAPDYYPANVEAWHPLPGAPLRFRLRVVATLRLRLGAGSGLSSAVS